MVLVGCNSQDKENTILAKDLQSAIAEFENDLTKDLSSNVSISGVIVSEKEIIWSKAFGISDTEAQVKADTTIIYRTGSISKSFTAFLMMLLVEEGTIKLNDPVEKYFPEIKKLKGYSDSTIITFKQLAAHTSGLIREPNLKNAATGPISDWEDKILESIPKTNFKYKPDERFSYSNIGYGILGLAISRAANKPFMDLVEEKIFEPLNMENSYFVVPENKMSKLSKGLARGSLGTFDREKPKREHKGRGYKVPNGGIYSTPNDLAKFMLCNMGLSKKLLSKENMTLMQKSQSPGDKTPSYGLGFGIQQDSLLTVIGHGGMVAGYMAALSFDKEKSNGVILMRNYSGGEPNIMALSLNLLKALNELN